MGRTGPGERPLNRSTAIAAALLACACSPPPTAEPPSEGPTARITRLRIGDATPKDSRPAPVATDRLASALAAALTDAGLPGLPPDPLGIWRAWDRVVERADLAHRFWRVDVEGRAVYGRIGPEGIAPDAGPGEVKAVWTLEVSLRPPDGSPTLYAYAEASSAAEFAGADAAAMGPALVARVEAAAADAAGQIATQVETLRQPPEKLIAALSDASPAVRRAAAERLGMLRLGKAVPALAEQVKREDDRDALLRMIGALAEIGDDRAAEALIELANPRDREVLRAVLDALSVVGGSRVDDFLGILGHHDDADVRLMVEQARNRLEQRR